MAKLSYRMPWKPLRLALHLLDEKGIALSELVTALLVFGIAFSITTKTLLTTMAVYHSSKQARQNHYRSWRVQQYLQATLDAQDTHRQANLLRSHPAGTILYSNLSLNPITSRHDDLAPNPKSNALTAVETDTWCLLDLQPGDSKACLRYATKEQCQSPKRDSDSSWVGGISRDAD